MQPVMQLDAQGMDILRRIADIRAFLSGQASGMHGMTLARTMERRRQMNQEIETLKERWLNLGLKAAGLPNAIDPATKPEKEVFRQAPRIFCPPDEAELTAVRDPKAAAIATHLRTTEDNVQVLIGMPNLTPATIDQ